MTLHWSDFPGAPEPGASLCAARDVPTTGVLSLDVAGFPVLVMQTADGLRAYVNMCPHQFLPLDHRAGDIRSADGDRLICSNHDAVFATDDGSGVGGFGQGCALSPVPLAQRDGQVFIA